MEPKPAPLVPLIVMDLVMVTAPKPPGSSVLISPPAAVLEIAPAYVLQGAVRLQGFTSSPTPDTQVRVACAQPGMVRAIAIAAKVSTRVIMEFSLFANLHM